MKKNNNFCHAIGCSFANKRHIEEKCKCVLNETTDVSCMCNYFTKLGEIDLLFMKEIQGETNYRDELQIVAALTKNKI